MRAHRVTIFSFSFSFSFSYGYSDTVLSTSTNAVLDVRECVSARFDS
jgi:hypothetical protein